MGLHADARRVFADPAVPLAEVPARVPGGRVGDEAVGRRAHPRRVRRAAARRRGPRCGLLHRRRRGRRRRRRRRDAARRGAARHRQDGDADGGARRSAHARLERARRRDPGRVHRGHGGRGRGRPGPRAADVAFGGDQGWRGGGGEGAGVRRGGRGGDAAGEREHAFKLKSARELCESKSVVSTTVSSARKVVHIPYFSRALSTIDHSGTLGHGVRVF